MTRLILLASGLRLGFSAPALAQPGAPDPEPATAFLRREAQALVPLVGSRLARDFWSAAPRD